MKSPLLAHLAIRRVFLTVGFLAIFALFQTACVQLAEIDATHAPRYSSMIGRTFELKEDLLIRGVKRPDQRSSEPNYLLVMPPPGIGGHLILDLGRVPAGSRFQVIGVVARKSKLFPSTEYVIAFSGHSIAHAENKDVRISDTSSWELYIKPASPGEAPQLNDRYFRPIGTGKN